MKILCISEHFHPKVGGTVTYVHQSCKALAALGHEVMLLYPGQGAPNSLLQERIDSFGTVAIGIGTNIKTAFPRTIRYQFCKWAEDYVNKMVEQKAVDVVHIMYGMFLNEVLDTQKWRDNGVAVFTTVHNVPPAECGLSWEGDTFLNYQKDQLRKFGVKIKNHRRLRAHPYDGYITPSSTVTKLLRQVLPDSPIYTIGHGTNPPENRPVFSSDGPLERVQILTAGGFVPHKNQHAALEAAHLLKEKGRLFAWHMVGPIRHKEYYQFLQQRLQKYDLQDQVFLEGEVPFSRLQDLYRDSNLYVQPSLEEGFCMTALDAAKYGLPIIGTPAGAIPEIIQMSGGILTEPQAGSLAEAIDHWMQIAPQYSTTAEAYSAMLTHFTWENAARQLDQLYHAKRP